MDDVTKDRFVRIPNALIERLLKTRLTSVQWRILVWTLRNTSGWNRETTPFSWYRIAQELSLDRSGVVRAGNRLVQSAVLAIRQRRLCVQTDPRLWLCLKLRDGDSQLRTGGTGDRNPRNRGRQSSVFRRAKDRSKDVYRKERNLTKKEKNHDSRGWHSAGAARPVPGKYDRISQN